MRLPLKRTTAVALSWLAVGEVINDVYDNYTPARTYRQSRQERKSRLHSASVTLAFHALIDAFWPVYRFARKRKG